MSQQPKVSIIVPVYNPPAAYLRECIESLSNQTLKEIEIILIDNQSIENCPEILQEYAAKDSRIVLHRFEQNQGYPGAINQGIKMSTGEYLQIVDSDDYLAPNACELLYDKASSNNLEMVLMYSTLFDDRKKALEKDENYEWMKIPDKIQNRLFSFDDVKEFIFCCPSQAWNKFYKRSFIIEHNNFLDMDLQRACPDAFFSFHNYVHAKRMMCLKEHLYFYRTNIGSGVVGGLGAKNCNYYQETIKLFYKLNDFMNTYLQAEDKKLIVKVIILASRDFFCKIHKCNKKTYYNLLKAYFKIVDLNIFNQESLNYSNNPKWFKLVRNYPYWLYQFRGLFINENEYNKKVKFFGITLYKRRVNAGTTTERYLGSFFRIITKGTQKDKFLFGIKISSRYV